MKVDFPGLVKEKLPSGTIRYRVRQEGDKTKRTLLPVTPNHPKFREHYYAARKGISLDLVQEQPKEIKGSVGWLVDLYVAAMPGLGLHTGTIHQRTVFLEWLRSQVGEFSAAMPTSEVLKLRDKKSKTPGAADNFVKAVRAMYAWGVDRGHVKSNPATGIGKTAPAKGATPWSMEDLSKYRTRHPKGTMAHLCLTLFMFTAGRISDVYQLGRQHEVVRDGVKWLEWQPAKKGSSRVQIPILPPLQEAIDAVKIASTGPYLLTEAGNPFASAKALQNRFDAWVKQAGMEHRSSHGIRKAAGELLALSGATQYHIMAVHGHSNAKTSEVYTKGAERAQLASQAMQLLRGMEW